jgi:hypothetical protein
MFLDFVCRLMLHFLERITGLRLALSKGPNRVDGPHHFYLRRETSSFRNVFLETLDDGQSPKTRFFQGKYLHLKKRSI